MAFRFRRRRRLTIDRQLPTPQREQLAKTFKGIATKREMASLERIIATKHRRNADPADPFKFVPSRDPQERRRAREARKGQR